MRFSLLALLKRETMFTKPHPRVQSELKELEGRVVQLQRPTLVMTTLQAKKRSTPKPHLASGAVTSLSPHHIALRLSG